MAAAAAADARRALSLRRLIVLLRCVAELQLLPCRMARKGSKENVPFHVSGVCHNFSDTFTGGQVFMMSKVQCLFWSKIAPQRGEGENSWPPIIYELLNKQPR